MNAALFLFLFCWAWVALGAIVVIWSTWRKARLWDRFEATCDSRKGALNVLEAAEALKRRIFS